MTDNNDVSSTSTAIVIGGSIAGGGAAAALQPHFDRVLVLDRDAFPGEPANRKGVPHAHHYHALTVGGQRSIESLLPGFLDAVTGAGAPIVDLGSEIISGYRAGFRHPISTDLGLLLATRKLLEFTLRSRVGELANVQFQENTRVTGLTVDDDGRVNGVVAQRVGSADEVRFTADLVVDASGRGSQAPDWLDELGFETPPETTVNAHWGYATAYVRLPREAYPTWRGINLTPLLADDRPASTRGAAMWEQEGGVWVLTATGCAGDLPPADEEGFLGFLRSLESQHFGPLLDKVEFVTPIEAWRNTTGRLRGFADLSSRPERFIALGDAVVALNPVYGQGMSMSFLSAAALRTGLDELRARGGFELDGFAEKFQKSILPIVNSCWTVSTSSDYSVPGVEVNGVPLTEADRPASAPFTQRVLALALEDDEVLLKFLETGQLIRGPEWLFAEELQQRVKDDWDRLGSQLRVN